MKNAAQLGARLALGASVVLVLVAAIYAGIAPETVGARPAWLLLGAFALVMAALIACEVVND